MYDTIWSLFCTSHEFWLEICTNLCCKVFNKSTKRSRLIDNLFQSNVLYYYFRVWSKLPFVDLLKNLQYELLNFFFFLEKRKPQVWFFKNLINRQGCPSRIFSCHLYLRCNFFLFFWSLLHIWRAMKTNIFKTLVVKGCTLLKLKNSHYILTSHCNVIIIVYSSSENKSSTKYVCLEKRTLCCSTLMITSKIQNNSGNI